MTGTGQPLALLFGTATLALAMGGKSLTDYKGDGREE